MCKLSNILKFGLGFNLLEDVLFCILGGEGEGLMLGNVFVSRKNDMYWFGLFVILVLLFNIKMKKCYDFNRYFMLVMLFIVDIFLYLLYSRKNNILICGGLVFWL